MLPITSCRIVVTQLFWFARLQSLCKRHHESSKKREEARGYSIQIGVGGWPVDPRHPVYSRGRGGHEIFLRLPQRDRGCGRMLLSLYKKKDFIAMQRGRRPAESLSVVPLVPSQARPGPPAGGKVRGLPRSGDDAT